MALALLWFIIIVPMISKIHREEVITDIVQLLSTDKMVETSFCISFNAAFWANFAVMTEALVLALVVLVIDHWLEHHQELKTPMAPLHWFKLSGMMRD